MRFDPSDPDNRTTDITTCYEGKVGIVGSACDYTGDEAYSVEDFVNWRLKNSSISNGNRGLSAAVVLNVITGPGG